MSDNNNPGPVLPSAQALSACARETNMDAVIANYAADEGDVTRAIKRLRMIRDRINAFLGDGDE
jgi:hypothetical protein